MRENISPETPHDPRNAVAEPSARRDASCEDVQSLLGDIEATKIVAILGLRPSLAELEEAVMWARGENYLLGRHPLIGNAARIFEIIEADRDDDA